jgi:hypothetical protein
MELIANTGFSARRTPVRCAGGREPWRSAKSGRDTQRRERAFSELHLVSTIRQKYDNPSTQAHFPHINSKPLVII